MAEPRTFDVYWYKYQRPPGEVVSSETTIRLDGGDADERKPATTATFPAPGDYLLPVQTLDCSFPPQRCRTDGYLQVTVVECGGAPQPAPPHCDARLVIPVDEATIRQAEHTDLERPRMKADDNPLSLSSSSPQPVSQSLPPTRQNEGFSRDRAIRHAPGFGIACRGVRRSLVWPALRAHAGLGHRGAFAGTFRRRRAGPLDRDRPCWRRDDHSGLGPEGGGRAPSLRRRRGALGGVAGWFARAAARDRNIGCRQLGSRGRARTERPHVPSRCVRGMRRH